jgi:hypothetical protein
MPADAFAMRTKRNVVLYLDKELVAKSKALGFNLSKTFENHLKHLLTHFSTCNSVNNYNSPEKEMNNMGLPGFEPGSIEPKSTSLDQASRQPRTCFAVSVLIGREK